jgi:transposase
MRVYIGVDFHARQQTVSYLTTEDGEIHQCKLEHQKDDIAEFYRQFEGEVVVGMEASGYIEWFEEMLLKIGHEVWVGDSAEIRRRARRRQKNDKRDSLLILELMVKGDFPKVHRQTTESRQVLKQLRYRHRLVKIRTIAKNNVQALALSGGLLAKRQYTSKWRQELRRLEREPMLGEQAKQLVKIIEEVTLEIKRVEQWLRKQAEADHRVLLLQTHPGVGLLTSLVLVHTLWPVERFRNGRKVTAYLGMDPVEDSSADRVRIGSISKQGSRLARYLVIEAASTAAKSDKGLKSFYRRLMSRQGKPKAKVAVGRKLLVRCFIMLRDQIDYDEFLRRGVEVRSSRLATGPLCLNP